MGRPRAPHGTKGAFERHKREHSRVCDSCQAWKDAEKADTAPPKPKKASRNPFAGLEGVTITLPVEHRDPETRKNERQRPAKVVDVVAETLDNLRYVEDSMAAAEDAREIVALSKRKSELLRELLEYGGAEIAKKATVDPVDSMLSEAGGDSGNVTSLAGFTATKS